MATQRGAMLAEMDRSIANITMALTHLDRVGDAYIEHYPEVTMAILAICETLIMSGDIIEKLKEKM